jgi:hypothetical protein
MDDYIEWDGESLESLHEHISSVRKALELAEMEEQDAASRVSSLTEMLSEAQSTLWDIYGEDLSEVDDDLCHDSALEV